MMTTHQLKAARALLDWTQQDLARASGMHLNAINNLERGLTSPRQSTINKLKKTLEDSGIIFIGTRGVERAQQALSCRKLDGDGFLRALTDDMLSVLKDKDAEILSIFADIRDFDAHDPVATQGFYAQKTARGLKERVITRVMPGFYQRPYDACRVVAPEMLGGADVMVYADRVAFIVWETQEIAILKGEGTARTQRRMFDMLWATGRDPHGS